MARVFKSSTILIDFDNQRRVYSSVDQIPPEVRRRILAVFDGMQTGTIVIADRNGRKELARRMGGSSEAPANAGVASRVRLMRRWTLAALLVLLTAAVVFLGVRA